MNICIVNQETGLCPSRGCNVCANCKENGQRAGRIRFKLRVYSTRYTGLGAAGGSSRVWNTGMAIVFVLRASRGRDGLIAAGARDWRLKRVFRSEAAHSSHTLHFSLLLSHLLSPRQRPSHLPLAHSYNACRTRTPCRTRRFPARPPALTGQALLCLPVSPYRRASERALLSSRT